eukprot:CAMPEP_0197841516 /NCGR_PEP_ID=MMETSP1437-20131217/46226_1 /TAXON_ID=49252 ORGANISM="Eucampia antarctica, Strain CCMP1452" /NCGR_SAMPLE_ID=MMETSP1437 /ASSEMBLY_ACC=CAM_ASM_001096 /LENGTH=523 /DNA_ID=CAMNT_0043451291 /DNA_START=71 /DNA_END=1642 /DNA_ORIENTATION=+
MCKAPQERRSETTNGRTVISSSTSTVDDTNTKFITNEELRSHNTPKSAWASVHGKVIDITEFGKRHPGGDIIFLASGKDATILLETYHPRGVPSSLIRKLQLGVMKDGELKTSFYTWDSDFYKTLKKRVVNRLEELKLSRRGSVEIWIKAIFLLIGFWGCLIKMYTTTDNFTMACMWSISMGVFAAFIGTCIQHDGNHGAFAESRWLNKSAGWTLDMIGASAYTWEFQHMLGHHPYTNVLDMDESDKQQKCVDCAVKDKDQESDPDVFSSYPAMRMHPAHEPSWFHRYQHIYAPLLFSFMTLSKVMQQDIEVAINKRLSHIDANCRYGSFIHLFRFWTMKVLSTIYMMVLPCWYHGPAKGFALFFLGHITCGQVLATMFIVNHVIEGVSYGKKGENVVGNSVDRPTVVNGSTPMEATQKVALSKDANLPKTHYNDWAAVQCQTSVNWSSGSWFWNHFSGGLSHQIEHHLFPSICHTNYCYIQDVVQNTCIEYGVPYRNESSLFIAYYKMLRHLKHLGSSKKID